MLIYAVCDKYYRDTYGAAFLASARARGHEAEVICDGETAIDQTDACRYLRQRWQVMPGLVAKHGSVLMLDVDTIFRAPVRIDEDAEMGVFLRPGRPVEHPTLGGIIYCTERAMAFAEALAGAAEGIRKWGDDQRILAAIYDDLRADFSVQHFGSGLMDWSWDSAAPIFTAKGAVKFDNRFREKVQKWARKGEAVAC